MIFENESLIEYSISTLLPYRKEIGQRQSPYDMVLLTGTTKFQKKFI